MDEIEIYQIGLDLDHKMKILYFHKKSPSEILEFPKERIGNDLNILCWDFIGHCLLREDDSAKKVGSLIVEELMLEKF